MTPSTPLLFGAIWGVSENGASHITPKTRPLLWVHGPTALVSSVCPQLNTAAVFAITVLLFVSIVFLAQQPNLRLGCWTTVSPFSAIAFVLQHCVFVHLLFQISISQFSGPVVHCSALWRNENLRQISRPCCFAVLPLFVAGA